MKRALSIFFVLFATAAFAQWNHFDLNYRHVRTEYRMVYGSHADEGSGTVGSDLSGNGGQGNLLGNTTWVPGRFGNSWVFDGTGDFIAITNQSIQNLTSRFTLSVWVLLQTTNQAGKYVFSRRSTVSPTDQYAIIWNHSAAIPRMTYEFYAENTTGGGNPRTSFHVQVLDTNYHHLAVTYDGALIRMYQDGVETTNRVVTFVLTPPTTHSLRIGTSSGAADFWIGQIDAPRFYNRDLSPREVKSLFHKQ